MNQSFSNLEQVLIAEDHDIYSDGLAMLVKQMSPNAQIHEARDYPSALEILKNNPKPQLAFFDIKMPGATGLEGIELIKKQFPTLTIIVVSSLDFDSNIQQVINIGVNGFISKSADRDALKDAILRVLEGEVVVEVGAQHQAEHSLSKRQLQTLSYMALGKTNKEIAKALSISPHTAKEYVSKVIKTLGVENRTQAVQVAERSGLLLQLK